MTDYLDGALDSRARAEFATHRLRCSPCRELFNDVRATVGALGSVAKQAVREPSELEARILAATTAGEMLSCREFDQLIERYFDGVILAPTFQTFQAHFESCSKCRRLLAGIEEAIALCREMKEDEVEVPHSLFDRIVAATVGVTEAPQTLLARWQSAGKRLVRPLWTPQWAAAALIFAASFLLIISRFGSVSGMASEASAHAERLVIEGHETINQTGAMAITGFQRVSSGVSTMLKDAGEAKPKIESSRPTPQPSPSANAAPTRPPNERDEEQSEAKPAPSHARQAARSGPMR